MEYRPPYLWYYELSFGRNEGGSIYHEGVQDTMTKNWPRGQNTIWKIEPGVKISYVNWPRGQFTMGFKIPYMTPGHRSEIRVPTGVQGNEGDKLDFRVWPDENGLLGWYEIRSATGLLQNIVPLYRWFPAANKPSACSSEIHYILTKKPLYT